MRPVGEMRLETVIRLREPTGAVASEYTVRGSRVEVVNYWRDGSVHDHGEMSLDQFNAEIQRISTDRQTAGQPHNHLNRKD